MRAFAEAYLDELFVQQLGGQIPWGHNVYILDTVKDPAEREWYVRKTIDNGRSPYHVITQTKGKLRNKRIIGQNRATQSHNASLR